MVIEARGGCGEERDWSCKVLKVLDRFRSVHSSWNPILSIVVLESFRSFNWAQLWSNCGSGCVEIYLPLISFLHMPGKDRNGNSEMLIQFRFAL